MSEPSAKNSGWPWVQKSQVFLGFEVRIFLELSFEEEMEEGGRA